MFENLQIIVSSEEEKKELLKGCKHIHDFTVLLQNDKSITAHDEFGEIRPLEKDTVGVCLNFDKYLFVNFLAGLHDCDDKSVREKFIKVQKSGPYTKTWNNVKKAKETIKRVKSKKRD